MPIAVAVWSVCVKPGEDGASQITPPADIRITNIALSDELADQSARTTIKLNYLIPTGEDSEEDEEGDDDEDDEHSGQRLESTVLCSLTPGQIEQATVDVTLREDEDYLFEVVGPNTVYISGNYIDQTPNGVPYNEGSEPYSDEEDFDLRDVSSDAEMDSAALDGISDDEDRFEEIVEEPESTSASTGKKRPRESNGAAVTETPEKLSKTEKKKNKKLKAESGAAVPSGAPDGPQVNGQTTKDKSQDKKDKKEKEKPADGAKTKTLDGGIQVTDVTVGKGPQAKKGSTVNMRYIGKLANGKVFDSNTKGKPFTFTLGTGEVIKGWDLGIAGMQAGGERKLVIPPKMAYGSRKSGPIPANSTLTFEVKMVDIK